VRILNIEIINDDDTVEHWRIDHMAPDYNDVMRKRKNVWEVIGSYESIGKALLHVVTGKKS